MAHYKVGYFVGSLARPKSINRWLAQGGHEARSAGTPTDATLK
jgi:hypothetical protein